MANGLKAAEDFNEEFTEAEQHIYSFAEEFSCENLIEKDKDGFFPTDDFEDELEDIISDYEDDCFWDALIHHLARKKFLEKYDMEKVDKMELEEMLNLEQPFIDEIHDELNRNGLKNIGIIK